MNGSTPFHYAFKVRDLDSTRRFYIDILGCQEGRSTGHWMDFNFFGHQLSAHVSESIPNLDYCGIVDGVKVPIPHFGCVLQVGKFTEVKNRLESVNIPFIIPPQIRYPGQTGEQHTLFVLDFSNNPIEIKSFTHPEKIFSQ